MQFGINAMAFGSGLRSGINGFMATSRPYDDPALAHEPHSYVQQVAKYRLLWSYYSGAMFDQSVNPLFNGLRGPYNVSSTYKARYNLYRNIRLIYNPVNRLVEFYTGALYPGVLSEDGKELPDAMQLAIPFAKDMDTGLKDAVAQWWQWTNWQAKKSIEIRYAAALGNCLVEVIDDLEHGKITASIPWPGDIPYIQVDDAGNVQEYLIQYQAYDQQGIYTYQKLVTGKAILYFRNDEPYDYGYGSEVENPYGFVPAVWIKHTDSGSLFGTPAIAGSLGKIDQLNSTASHLHDYFGKRIGSPQVFWSDSDISRIFNTSKRGATDSFTTPTGDEESVFILQGGQGGRSDPLVSDMNVAEVVTAMNSLMAEIENDHPELAFYRELRAMSQVTGPAASRLVGDVAHKVSEAQATYDQANIKLFQMAVAIGGYRANTGDWGELNSQQQKFLPFNLDSYTRGDLDMVIMPRPLLTPTRQEIAQENELIYKAVYYASFNQVPAQFVLQDAGWTDEKITLLTQAVATKAQQDQQAAKADTIPARGQ